MPVQETLQKFKVPLGSLVVDIGLVIYVTFTAGQIVERLETVNGRVARLEEQTITAEADRRLTTLEAQEVEDDRLASEQRREVITRLERIEDKIDDHLVQTGGKP